MKEINKTKKRGVILILSMMLFLLSFLICWQFKTVTASQSDILQLQREDTLRDEVVKWKTSYENISEKLTETESKLKEYMNNISQTDKTTELLKNEIEDTNKLAGLTEVKGPGILITMEDAEVLNPNYLQEDQIIHDTDILRVVNELRASGAEAISINEQRVTNLTAIRCVGPTILVNDIKIGAPFKIKAIGNADNLYSGINLIGGIVDTMKRYGIQVDVKKQDEVTIPRYEGVVKMTYTKESGEE